MNFYISLAILTFFIIWFFVSAEKSWLLGEALSCILGVFWLSVGVGLTPLILTYNTETETLHQYKIECTSRSCYVYVGTDVFEAGDAFSYNTLKDTTFDSLMVTRNYNWWGSEINKKLIVK